jgi:hypothetical protein
MVWIWQHDKRTDDYKIILNCVRNLMKNKSEKEARKGPSFKKIVSDNNLDQFWIFAPMKHSLLKSSFSSLKD